MRHLTELGFSRTAQASLMTIQTPEVAQHHADWQLLQETTATAGPDSQRSGFADDFWGLYELKHLHPVNYNLLTPLDIPPILFSMSFTTAANSWGFSWGHWSIDKLTNPTAAMGTNKYHVRSPWDANNWRSYAPFTSINDAVLPSLWPKYTKISIPVKASRVTTTYITLSFAANTTWTWQARHISGSFSIAFQVSTKLRKAEPSWRLSHLVAKPSFPASSLAETSPCVYYNRKLSRNTVNKCEGPNQIHFQDIGVPTWPRRPFCEIFLSRIDV